MEEWCRKNENKCEVEKMHCEEKWTGHYDEKVTVKKSEIETMKKI